MAADGVGAVVGGGDGINTPSLAYAAMAKRWSLPDVLMGGTLEVRAGRTAWLPQDDRESNSAYDARLARSVVFPAYANTVTRLSSLPFSKPVTLKGAEAVDPRLRLLEEDADYSGTDVTQFARAAFEDATNHGLTHVLTDFPIDATGLSAGDEREAGIHPYFALVSPVNLIGWELVKGPTGRMRLVSIRIREKVVVREGWKETEVEQVRVVTAPTDGVRGMHVLYRRNAKNEWAQFEAPRPHTFPGVPLRTIYFRRTGNLTACPPMEDLAWLNLQHYQSDSDQRNILHVARVPVLMAAGLNEEEAKGGLTIGPNRIIRSANDNFRLEWVEHGGSAIGAGRQDLLDLQARMEVLGLQPMLQKTGDVTATASAIDEARVHADVHAWVRALESGLRGCFADAATYLNVPLPEDFQPDVYSDFGLSLRAAQDVQNLIALRNAGAITSLTLLRELQKRGLLSVDVDVAAEAEAARDEGPALGLLGGFGGGGEGGDDDPADPVPRHEDDDEGREARRAA